MTNLLAFAASGLPFTRFAELMALPRPAEYLIFRRFFAADLNPAAAAGRFGAVGGAARGAGVRAGGARRHAGRVRGDVAGGGEPGRAAAGHAAAHRGVGPGAWPAGISERAGIGEGEQVDQHGRQAQRFGKDARPAAMKKALRCRASVAMAITPAMRPKCLCVVARRGRQGRR
jgi:hypothetical protein